MTDLDAQAQKLDHEHKTFVVTCLAQFMTPSEVVEAVKERYGIEMSRQLVHYYDPEHSKQLDKEWDKVFKAARAAFIKNTANIAIAHSAFRLRELDGMYREAKKSRLGKSQRAILEQAAKESGGAYTNKVKQEVTGKDGGPISHKVTPTDTNYRSAAAPLAPKEEPKTPPASPEKPKRKPKPKPKSND
jgi:hypothetical protein